MDHRANERGYTLAEILVVVAISSAVLIMCYELIEAAMRTSLFVESHNNLAQMAQRPINYMQTAVYQSKTVFQNDTTGNGYLNRFLNPPSPLPTPAPPTLPAMQANSLLPIVDTTNTGIVPDSGTGTSRLTGNCLFLVRQLPPLLVPYDPDPTNPNAALVNFPVDRYRFELFYLSQNTSRTFYTAPYFVDLIEARSVDFADYYQLNPLIGAGGTFVSYQITAITNGLAAAGLNLAWDPTGPGASNAFYSIASNGTMTLQPNQGIWVYSVQSLLPELHGGSISGKMLYTVGFRPSATTVFPTRSNFVSGQWIPANPIPKYAVYDSTIPNFPSGFEVKAVGSGAARKIMLRLVLLSNYGVSTIDSQEGFVITSG